MTNYLDLYIKQIAENSLENSIYYTEIYNEYCSLNCFLNDYPRTNQRIKELIVGDIKQMTSEELDLINRSVVKLKSFMEKLPKEFEELLNSINLEGVIFMIGDGTVDSHGILVEGKSYLIVDVSAYAKQLDNYNPISFLVHELTHCIHYYYRPEMYFRNYNQKSDKLLKRILVEGIAGYVTKETTSESDCDIFWLGYLDENEIDKWIAYSLSSKVDLSLKINDFLANDIWSDETQQTLFSVTDPDNLWKGRLAYYYGYELAKQYKPNSNLLSLIECDYETFYPYVADYFKLNL